MEKLFGTIYIHAGLPKTGTSFLQSALELIETKGGFKQTTYPVLNPQNDFQAIGSGNGLEIAKLLAESFTPEFNKIKITSAFSELLEKRSTNKNNLLISSEWFTFSSPERFHFFQQEMLKICNEVKLIFFVRPLAPWAWSRYSQGIKRHNLSDSFEEWADFRLADDVNRLVDNIFSLKAPVIPLPFRAHDVLPLLLRELLEDQNISALVPNQIVNRSLTYSENNILKIANEIFDDPSISTKISNSFIKEAPSSEPAKLSLEQAHYAERQLPEILNNLDKYACNTAKQIKDLLRADYKSNNTDDNSHYTREDVHQNIQTTLLALSAHYSESSQHSKSRQRLSTLMDYSSSLNRTRAPFDPVHYLLLNPDVLDAGVDPTAHFNKFGLKEQRYTHLGIHNNASTDAAITPKLVIKKIINQLKFKNATRSKNTQNKNKRINEIIIHVGLHKTASSSIQKCLADTRNDSFLTRKHTLYPKKWPINHSIPIYSAFCKNPEKYHINIRQNWTKTQIEDLNESYLKTLKIEAADKNPTTLILSGEDISVLDIQGMAHFKKFLMDTFNPKKIKIIVYVRNPISFFISNIQESIKAGLHTIETSSNIDISTKTFSTKRKLEDLTEIFGKKSINAYTFESATKHHRGPVGHFLSLIGFDKHKDLDKFYIEKSNESISLLAANIISFINKRCPLFVDGAINKSRRDGDTIPLSKLEGDKFDIPQSKKLELRDAYNDEIIWLRDSWGIDYSEDTYSDRNNETSVSEAQLIQTKKIHGECSPVIQSLIEEYLNRRL